MDLVRLITDLFRDPFDLHIFVGMLSRLALIQYADYHDQNFDVPYTDIDYKVFTDAARYVYMGQSPYKRHTYRYSPLIAYLLLPNVFFFKQFGKVLFCIFDLLITLAIKKIVDHQLGRRITRMTSISMYCALFWLYNPMSIAISTRGSADSVPCFLIIMSILFLQTNVATPPLKYTLAGCFLGVSIHLRLYPICFSFPMYLSLGNRQLLRRVTFTNIILLLIPNKNQLALALSCIFTLVSLTSDMYYLYGYDFLFETYIYHLFRKDTKHNFSVLFYSLYLSMDDFQFDIMKPVIQFLECTILFVLSLTFGYDPKTLPFCLFCQTVVLVAYNSVVTSQYFIWFLSLLPLVVHSFKLRVANAVMLIIIWVTPQAAWLFYAYLLEFKSKEVFIFLWISSLMFFCSNIIVLSQLIKCYTLDYGFGQIDNSMKSLKLK